MHSMGNCQFCFPENPGNFLGWNIKTCMKVKLNSFFKGPDIKCFVLKITSFFSHVVIMCYVSSAEKNYCELYRSYSTFEFDQGI